MPSSQSITPPHDAPLSTPTMMENHELGTELTTKMTAMAFEKLEVSWGDEGSPYRRFYEEAAGMPKKRVIVWNTTRSYTPRHLFFRAVDTGRLLAMDNAPFRVQIWQHKNTGYKSKDHQFLTFGIIHELLLLRNMHDLGCADIPIIICDLNREEMEAALDYWVWLSKKGNTTHPDRAEKFQTVFSLCDRTKRLPCFYQLDLTVRKILAKPLNNGFVPPFLILCPLGSQEKEGHKAKAKILFTRACAVPPKRLMDLWPNTCGGKGCEDPDCELIEIPRHGKTRAWVLSTQGELVTNKNTRGDVIQGEHYCNHWPCRKKQTPENKMPACKKCKGVLYCSKEHQRMDWQLHRAICGSGPRDDTGFQIPRQITMGLADGTVKQFDSQFDWYDMQGATPDP